jgi:FecR protein
MYRCHKWTPALLLMTLFAMSSTGSVADTTSIGVAASTRPDAEGVVGTQSHTLLPGSQLYANERIRTGRSGRADLVLIDKTNLTVGPASEVLLDKFVYDPTGSSAKVVINATRGVFRFVTGEQDHRAYQINTPYGTLGVRGTVVEIVVSPPKKKGERRQDECAARVRLVEGKGATYRTPSGKTAELTDPNQVVCVTELGDVSYSTSTTSILEEVGDVGGGGGGPPIVTPPGGGTIIPPEISPAGPAQ